MVVNEGTKKVIERIAEKHGISYMTAYSMWISQFKSTAEEIAKAVPGDPDSFPICYIPSLGTLYVSKRKMNRITECHNKKKEKKQKEIEDGLDVHTGFEGPEEGETESGDTCHTGV